MSFEWAPQACICRVLAKIKKAGRFIYVVSYNLQFVLTKYSSGSLRESIGKNKMLVIVGASGKLGFATLNALLDHNLILANSIVCTTSSDTGAKKLEPVREKGVQVKRANWDDRNSFKEAFQGCDKLFLISSSRIQKDFNNAPPGLGRESDHYTALKAARDARVKHIYYTSLAFAKPSKSRVMKAHERTEEWLKVGTRYTIIREGLYNESWPLYFGHYKVGQDDRNEVPVAGDGQISWTSVSDLGLANALILAAPSDDWTKKIVYLSQSKTHSLEDVAAMVSKARGKEMTLKVVPRDEHEKYYIEERGMGEPYVKWWSKSLDAVKAGECDIQDPTLETLLDSKGVKPKQLEHTIEEMLKA